MKHNKTTLGVVTFALVLSACGPSEATNTPEPSVAVQNTPTANLDATIAVQSTQISTLSTRAPATATDTVTDVLATSTPQGVEAQGNVTSIFSNAQSFSSSPDTVGYLTEASFFNSAREGYRVVAAVVYVVNVAQDAFNPVSPSLLLVSISIRDSRGFQYECKSHVAANIWSNLKGGLVFLPPGVGVPYLVGCAVPNNATQISLNFAERFEGRKQLLTVPLPPSGYLASPELAALDRLVRGGHEQLIVDDLAVNNELIFKHSERIIVDRSDVPAIGQTASVKDFVDITLVSAPSSNAIVLRVKNNYGLTLRSGDVTTRP